jgi:hypothetical protein
MTIADRCSTVYAAMGHYFLVLDSDFDEPSRRALRLGQGARRCRIH